MADVQEQEYILGTDAEELERLGLQHEVWVRQAFALWEAAGFRAGDVVADLGCGPGFTTFDLATIVGPTGRVIARDESSRFLTFLEAERTRRGLHQIAISPGTVETLDLEPETLDGAYARWLLCWLPDPRAALERVARALRPGGAIAVQDYLDWGAMKLLPRSAIHDRAVQACMQSWRDGEGEIDVGEHLPAHAEALGLRLERFQPIARLGRVGSLEWRWLGTFFATYLPRLVARGRLEEAERQAFAEEWARRTREGTSFCYTPTVVDVVLRKP